MSGPRHESAELWVVEPIRPGESQFRAVIDLWRQNRKNLGLFPEGAFEACAADGFLLGAFRSDGQLAGYLAYRIHRRLNRAAIAHLCVETSVRGRAVSDALFRAVRDAAKERRLDYILLKCRRDYEVDAMWKRLGFIARGETPGRGEDGAVLTAAARGQVFLTRDGELLDAAAELEAKLDVKVMRPADLLSSLDEVERSLAYQPARLAGTSLQLGLLTADEIDACLDCFQSTIKGETRAQFTDRTAATTRHVVS